MNHSEELPKKLMRKLLSRWPQLNIKPKILRSATQSFGSGDTETNSFQQREIETNTLHEEHHE